MSQLGSLNEPRIALLCSVEEDSKGEFSCSIVLLLAGGGSVWVARLVLSSTSLQVWLSVGLKKRGTSRTISPATLFSFCSAV